MFTRERSDLDILSSESILYNIISNTFQEFKQMNQVSQSHMVIEITVNYCKNTDYLLAYQELAIIIEVCI